MAVPMPLHREGDPSMTNSWNLSGNATTERVGHAIDVVVEEILITAGIEEPPVDTIELARRLDLDVAWDRSMPTRARMVRSARGAASGRTSILLRPEPRHERRQWAVAHEIGESEAHRIFARLDLCPNDVAEQVREQVANLFANRLLLPSRWFLTTDSSGDWDLFQLKDRFSTASHEVIARRSLDFGHHSIVTIFDQGKITFRGASFASSPPGPTMLERRCQKTVHELGERHHETDEQVSVTGWPICEPGWHREILRLTAHEDGFDPAG
ncbi:MAG: ImmA/IrrE family metallo-endopeptidase [Planctomycetota bacterium]|nr:MAG: ImmA/IrrE family metallo-endopeptidase [Planctomycetota bacterium]